MSAGIWAAPALLAGLFVILWTAAWLERLVAPPAFDPKLGMPEADDTGFADIGGGPTSVAMGRQSGTEFDRWPA